MRTDRLARALLPVLSVGLLIPLAAVHRGVADTAAIGGREPAADRAAQLAALPLSFEPNVGQADPRVRYLARGTGFTVCSLSAGWLSRSPPRRSAAPQYGSCPLPSIAVHPSWPRAGVPAS
jgi:hypothetical protein